VTTIIDYKNRGILIRIYIQHNIPIQVLGPSWPWSNSSWIYNYLCNWCLSPLMLWFRIPLRGGCIILCDEACHWLAAGRWFSSGTLHSSTNKSDRHDIADILMKVALNTIKPNLIQVIHTTVFWWMFISTYPKRDNSLLSRILLHFVNVINDHLLNWGI
jgi:hypothetical protein